MATELVIGPMITMVSEKASSYLLDQYRVMDGMEEQRKILERKLPAILDIIQDAEEKGAFRPGVRAWLKDLKAVSYVANDVFDEIKYEALRREAQNKGHHRFKALTSFPARNPIVFRYRMGKKLRKIVQTIEVLVTEMNTFGFRHLQQAPPSKQWRNTDPIMVDFDQDIIKKSRKEEKEKIMSILLDEASSRDLTVLPIVGMGGLGKTTFVQLIYNDPAIEKHFELRRWCCVLHDFDTARILFQANVNDDKGSEKALQKTNVNDDKGSEKALQKTNVNDDKGSEKALQNPQNPISGKRYLIVLDDVWDTDEDKWGKLKSCLRSGGKGSAVLTTTRNSEIARRMAVGVAEAYNIKNLSDKHLKEIVQNRAFSLQRPNSDDLDATVDKIVDRCAGSPLAAKAFGSMLSTKTSMNEWKDILTKTNIFAERTGFLPILKLSFDDLPSYMKSCFAFCAIFPKDYEIDVELLIQLWMAHDFIPLQEGDHPEAVGEKIFKELTWRSFFQDVNQSPNKFKDRFQFRKKTTCKIHDLMHDIALFIMGKECVTMVDNSSKKKPVPDSTRHAFFRSERYDERKFLDDILKKQFPTLQTFFCEDDTPKLRNISKCTSLRALHLPGMMEYQVGLKHLHHLRYLDLSGIWQLKELPEDISIMYNLQTLNISYCWSLRKLPRDMKYMASLRHLYTHGCRSLTCMPPELGQITSLQTLTYFVAGANSGCSTIGELKSINLGGELELSYLEKATEGHAKDASLENKEKLTHLYLEWNDKGQEELEQDCHKKVLHALKPHAGLEMIKIVNYKSASLPSWIEELSLLTELRLRGCSLCEELPQISHLNALQVLYLENLDKLRSLCSDTASTPFPKLKVLRLEDLESLERWVAPEGNELIFPVLEELHIRKCPKLKSLPQTPNLTDITVHEDKALLSLAVLKSRHYISSLSKLKVSTRDTEEASTHDTEEATPCQIDKNHESSLLELVLKGSNFFYCSSPSCWACQSFTKLVRLKISKCDALICWPEELFQSLASLKDLDISSCNKLIGRAQGKEDDPTRRADQVLPRLNKIIIHYCARLAELFILPPSLRTIFIGSCPRLEYIWGEEEHQETCTDMEPEYSSSLAPTSVQIKQLPSPTNCCPCLEALHIYFCDNLIRLPNLPPSLKTLYIDGCKKLCSVSGCLDALETLNIDDCSKLQSLDSVGNLPSLETLDLGNCQCLASLPGVLGTYPSLRKLYIKYCPAIDLKPLSKRHQNRLNSLEVKDISHAHSCNPCQGPKLRDSRSWKYAIPGVADWTKRRHRM